MTTYGTQNVTCGACSKTFTRRVLNSTNSMGSADLDLRPPPMQRHTMDTWISRCPSCGFCSPTPEKAPADSKALMEDAHYLFRRDDEMLPKLAQTFFAYAWQCRKEKNYAGAALAARSAAWVCDDSNNSQQAKRCRNDAIELLLEGKLFDGPEPEKPGREMTPRGWRALLVDLLRRTERFDEARTHAQLGAGKDPNATDPISRVFRFQQQLIEAEDTGVYTVADAMK